MTTYCKRPSVPLASGRANSNTTREYKSRLNRFRLTMRLLDAGSVVEVRIMPVFGTRPTSSSHLSGSLTGKDADLEMGVKRIIYGIIKAE